MSLHLRRAALMSPLLVGCITVTAWNDNGARFALIQMAWMGVVLMALFALALLIQRRTR